MDVYEYAVELFVDRHHQEVTQSIHKQILQIKLF